MKSNIAPLAGIIAGALCFLGLVGSITVAAIYADNLTTVQKNTCVQAGGSYSFDNGGSMICTVK